MKVEVAVLNKPTVSVDVKHHSTKQIPTSVQTAGAHWLADAVYPFGMDHAVFGTDRFS